MRKKGQFRIKSTTQIYKNPWIEVTEDKVIRPDGTDGIFGLLDMKDGVAILPVFIFLSQRNLSACLKSQIQMTLSNLFPFHLKRLWTMFSKGK